MTLVPATGYAIREQNRYVFDDPAINAVEITFERADDPLRTNRYIGDLDLDYASVHALKLSVGSPDPPGKPYMDALKAVAIENGAASVSDHLGFTRDGEGGVEMGHFALMPLTQEALDVTCRNIDYVQQYFAPMHFFIENIAYLYQFAGSLGEAEFLSKILSRTGCGWLLDVTNVYANARNFKFDAYEFIERVMPSAERVQMHLAGGFYDEKAGMYIDSHSHPLPKEVWDLYKFSLEKGRGKVDAVFVERDQNFPDEGGWRSEIGRVRQLAAEASGEAVAGAA